MAHRNDVLSSIVNVIKSIEEEQKGDTHNIHLRFLMMQWAQVLGRVVEELAELQRLPGEPSIGAYSQIDRASRPRR